MKSRSWKSRLLAVGATALLGALPFTAGCDDEPDTVGEAVDQTMDDVQDAADDAGDSIEDAADDLGDAVDDATDGRSGG